MSTELIGATAAIAGILTVIVSIIVFIFQYKQNYTQNVFQMMKVFHELLHNTTFLSKKEYNNEKADIFRNGFILLKFFLLHIQGGTREWLGENEEKMISHLADKIIMPHMQPDNNNK